MSRVKRGIITKRRHKKILKQSKGYYSARGKVFRSAKQAVIKSHQYSYRDRKCKKREFRKLWIIRINAALKNYGITYNKFIYNLRKISLTINRKILSNLAINDIKTFEYIVNKAKGI